VHASWYKIGLQLDIHYHWLDAIELDYPDSKNRMHEMLKHWVRNAVPTWEAVVTALRSPVVGMNLVAEQLESKYCTPVQHNIMIGKFITKIEKSMGFVTMCKMQSHLWFTRGTNAVGSKGYA